MRIDAPDSRTVIDCGEVFAGLVAISDLLVDEVADVAHGADPQKAYALLAVVDAAAHWGQFVCNGLPDLPWESDEPAKPDAPEN